MEKVTKEIKSVKYETVFMSNDGHEFIEEKECAAYEKTCEGVIHGEFAKAFGVALPGWPDGSKRNEMYQGLCMDMFPLYFCHSCEDAQFIITPKDKEQIEIINKVLEANGNYSGDLLGEEMIGQELLFEVDYENSIYYEGTVEETRKSFETYLFMLRCGANLQCKNCKYCNEENKCTCEEYKYSYGKDTTDRRACYHFELKEDK